MKFSVELNSAPKQNTRFFSSLHLFGQYAVRSYIVNIDKGKTYPVIGGSRVISWDGSIYNGHTAPKAIPQESWGKYITKWYWLNMYIMWTACWDEWPFGI